MNELPLEIIEEVFLWLDVRSILTCFEVCWFWRNLAINDKQWRPRCQFYGWRFDERYLYDHVIDWQNNFVMGEVEGQKRGRLFIRELMSNEIEARRRASRKPEKKGQYQWYELFARFYSTEQPCIPPELSALEHYQAKVNLYTNYSLGGGIFILPRPSGFTLEEVRRSNTERTTIKDCGQATLVNYNYNPRVVRDIVVWVGSNLPTDDSPFKTNTMPRQMYSGIKDVNEFADICPFCLTKPAKWRVILRLEICLSHEDYSAFEAQCQDCRLYFLFSYGRGC